MDPINKNKAQETTEIPNDIKETEWCEYSGMPSPAYYLKEEETDENKNVSHTNLS